ncbi:MAG: rRNA methyltransferase [Bacteroidota bacterium]
MNLPSVFEQDMKARLGQQFEAFSSSLDEVAPVSVRWNVSKSSLPEGFQMVPWMADAFYLDKRPVFTLDPLFHAGAYYVQEASSMFLAHILKHLWEDNEPVKALDLCGAPGGKSTLMASMLPEKSFMLTNEVIRSRANILVENVQKWGHAEVAVSNNDPKDFQALAGFFDLMLIDAPCSGEGLFRRDPKAAEIWTPSHVDLCSDRQRRILMDSWDCLKEGGYLIYSTCTFNEKENEENLIWLSQQVEVESVSIPIEESWGIEEVRAHGMAAYRFYPHQVKGEGLFMAILRKEEGRTFKLNKRKKALFQKVDKHIQEEVGHWIREGKDLAIMQLEEELFAWPTHYKAEIELLQEKLKLLHPGMPLAEIKRKNLSPLHGLAMSSSFQADSFQQAVLTHEQALKYLHRDSLALDLEQGLNLLTFEGLPLGFAKQIKQRTNNYYPQHWRIRMNIPHPSEWASLKNLSGS